MKHKETMGHELTSHGETTEAPLRLQLLGLANGGRRGEDHGVQDEAVFIPLHLANHLSLLLRGAVVVDNTQTTEQSHVDGHVVLSDGVHGGRHEGSLQGHPLGDGGIQNDVRSGEACHKI